MATDWRTDKFEKAQGNVRAETRTPTADFPLTGSPPAFPDMIGGRYSPREVELARSGRLDQDAGSYARHLRTGERSLMDFIRPYLGGANQPISAYDVGRAPREVGEGLGQKAFELWSEVGAGYRGDPPPTPGYAPPIAVPNRGVGGGGIPDGPGTESGWNFGPGSMISKGQFTPGRTFEGEDAELMVRAADIREQVSKMMIESRNREDRESGNLDRRTKGLRTHETTMKMLDFLNRGDPTESMSASMDYFLAKRSGKNTEGEIAKFMEQRAAQREKASDSVKAERDRETEHKYEMELAEINLMSGLSLPPEYRKMIADRHRTIVDEQVDASKRAQIYEDPKWEELNELWNKEKLKGDELERMRVLKEWFDITLRSISMKPGAAA